MLVAILPSLVYPDTLQVASQLINLIKPLLTSSAR